MLLFYVACLVAGVGVISVQLFAGHDAAGGHDLHHGDDGGHEGAPWAIFASVRFWAFALLASGLVGTLLTFFDLAGPGLTGALAAVAGLGSGAFAVTVVARLLHRSPQSLASRGDVVGRVGRVVVAIAGQGRGKVRVDLKGAQVDVVARAREGSIDEGEAVVIEEMTDGEALVSKAPRELAP